MENTLKNFTLAFEIALKTKHNKYKYIYNTYIIATQTIINI